MTAIVDDLGANRLAPLPDTEEPLLVRLALPDRPGGLALVTRCLAACGVDILTVDVVGHEAGRAIDDLIIRGGDLARALGALAPDAILLGTRPAPPRADPALRMAEALAAVFAARTLSDARDALVDATLRLVGADDGVLLCSADAATLQPVASTVGPLPPIAPDDPSVARRVLRSRKRYFGRCDTGWAPRPHRDAIPASHIACVPAPSASGVLLVARHDDFPFVESEVERLEFLARTISSPAV